MLKIIHAAYRLLPGLIIFNWILSILLLLQFICNYTHMLKVSNN